MAALVRLRARGLDIELREVSGVPNEQVLRLFAESDVVVDQLVGGFYGYTALEAMAVGRAVITYVRSDDLLLPGFPLLNATPDTIEQLLQDLYDGRFDLDALGAQGQRYIREQQSIPAVSRRLADMYARGAVLTGAAC
jgi:glycosyltransferase involved in cell wall biosynthesis